MGFGQYAWQSPLGPAVNRVRLAIIAVCEESKIPKSVCTIAWYLGKEIFHLVGDKDLD
jgi:hypothetical protein